MTVSMHDVDIHLPSLPVPRVEHGLAFTRWSPAAAAVVEAGGDVDLHTAPALAQHLMSCLTECAPRALVVDLRKVSFLVLAGVRVLIAAHHRAAAQHTDMCVVAQHHAVRRALALTATHHALVVYPTLALALAD